MFKRARIAVVFLLAVVLAPAIASPQPSPAVLPFSGVVGPPPPSVPFGAVAASAQPSRDDVLERFALCADDVITTLFADTLVGVTRGVGSRSLTRAYFWSCAFWDGWPSGSYSSDFIASPVAIAESVLAGGDGDLVGSAALTAELAGICVQSCTPAEQQQVLELVAEGLRTNNCWTYYYLWLALTGAMSTEVAAQLTAPDVAGVCGVPQLPFRGDGLPLHHSPRSSEPWAERLPGDLCAEFSWRTSEGAPIPFIVLPVVRDDAGRLSSAHYRTPPVSGHVVLDHVQDVTPSTLEQDDEV